MFPPFRIKCGKVRLIISVQQAEARRIHKRAARGKPKLRMARRMPAALRFAGKPAHSERKLRQKRIEKRGLSYGRLPRKAANAARELLSEALQPRSAVSGHSMERIPGFLILRKDGCIQCLIPFIAFIEHKHRCDMHLLTLKQNLSQGEDRPGKDTAITIISLSTLANRRARQDTPARQDLNDAPILARIVQKEHMIPRHRRHAFLAEAPARAADMFFPLRIQHGIKAANAF